jgi:7-cyano-7-deazaguanine synthase in queuosine biosynthesis
MNQIQLISPFTDIYKDEVMGLGFALNKEYGYDMYDSVWSCYRGEDQASRGDKQCGHCSTCSELMYGYINAGASDEYILNKFDITQQEMDDLREGA